MHQINDAALLIIGTKINKFDHQLSGLTKCTRYSTTKMTATTHPQENHSSKGNTDEVRIKANRWRYQHDDQRTP